MSIFARCFGDNNNKKKEKKPELPGIQGESTVFNKLKNLANLWIIKNQ